VPVATLNNPSPAPNDFFGQSVAVSGTRVAVGPPHEETGVTNAGSVYVYDLSAATPTVPVATLNNPSPAADDQFGYAVAISGSRVVVGSMFDDTGADNTGSAYLYDLTSGTPAVPIAALNNPSPAANDLFGYAVAISGMSAVVGAFGDDAGGIGAGAAYIMTPYDLWINSFASLANPADRLKTANPDKDEFNNLSEFALDGHPASGAKSKVSGRIATVGGIPALTLTIPVRLGAVLDLGDPPGGVLVLRQANDGLVYTIQASTDLATVTPDVTEVTGADAAAIQAGLPALNMLWTYRTFRAPGPASAEPRQYLRAVISQ
jgi:FG-GAP repeat